ncbi:MAG TPA: anti-sigma factor [Rhodopseudomonas sp.]|uniref:anti-sigma factor n=1 Tax=Rhodopseudomonas sp. TaxID=1078 RepID=UPI002ED83532
MDYSEDHIALAAEYALGTLDADERAQVQSMMSVDNDFAAIVEAWERRLGALNQMVDAVEPAPEVWERIQRAAGLSGAQHALEIPPLPATPATPAAATPAEPAAPDAAAPTGLSPESKRVVHFAFRAKMWQWGATGIGAIAAGLFAIIVAQLAYPDILPNELRPAIRTQVVQVAGAPPPIPAQYVALLQKDAASPAFILTVNAASKEFTVRKVGAEQEPGRSYELWLVSDKLQRPRSLGVIGGDDFTIRAALAAFDSDTVSKATYAVTVEPEGGSPTGVATGPIVFTGKLIETVPPVAPAR